VKTRHHSYDFIAVKFYLIRQVRLLHDKLYQNLIFFRFRCNIKANHRCQIATAETKHHLDFQTGKYQLNFTVLLEMTSCPFVFVL